MHGLSGAYAFELDGSERRPNSCNKKSVMNMKDAPAVGRGRRPGTGQFGDAETKVVRVPVKALPQVDVLVAQYRVDRPRVPAVPAALDPPRLVRPEFSVRVPAGFPSPADDYLEDGCDLNQLLISNAPATFFYRVSGDSMSKAGILHNDLVIVNRALTAVDGDIVIAVITGEGHTIKRLNLRRATPVLEPDSHNPEHKPRGFADGDELIVWGVVTGCVRQFGRTRR